MQIKQIVECCGEETTMKQAEEGKLHVSLHILILHLSMHLYDITSLQQCVMLFRMHCFTIAGYGHLI